jgi:hypothetical protein
MARKLGDLGRQMRKLATDIPARANTLKQQVASTINFNLLQTTPVDTGLALSNWQVNLDEAATAPRPAFKPSAEGYMQQTDGAKAWTHRGDTETTRQANIAPALELANATINTCGNDQSIHITNTLPYIRALDEGHSSQAELFVDKSILLAEKLVSRATLVD